MMMMNRLDQPPERMKAALAACGVNPELLLACVVGDLGSNEQFGEVGIAVDENALWVYPPLEDIPAIEPGDVRPLALPHGGDIPAASSNPASDSHDAAPSDEPSTYEETTNGTSDFITRHGDVVRIPLSRLTESKVESYVGSAAYAIKIGDEQVRLALFTNTASRKFIIFARLVSRLIEGEPLRDEDYTDGRLDSHCPKCGRLYPEAERKVCPHCVDRRTLTLRIFTFFGDYKWRAIAVIALMIAGAGLSLLSPYINGRVLFDDVLTPGGKYEGQIVGVVLVMAAFQLATIGLGVWHARISSHMTAFVIAELKSKVFDALQRLSLGFFTNKQTGGLMTRVNGDANNLQYFFNDGFPYFIVNMLQIIFIVSIMVWMNAKLALLVFIPIPLIVYTMVKVFPKLWRLFSRRHRANRSLNAVVNDALSGVRVVKAFGKEEVEVERFNRRSQRVYDVALVTGFFSSTLFPLLGWLMQSGGLIVWGVGGWDVLGGHLTFGTLITFTGYLGMLYGPLEFMTHIVDWWTQSTNSAQRIFEILDAVPDVTEKSNPVRLDPMQGEIELKDVTFSYEPNKPILKNVSFRVEAGEMIGLVGHSGAGKSTLTNVISRLFDVDEGQVLIDGVDVRDVAQQDLRRQIGIVPQETYLFYGSIAENIAYAKPDASRKEVIQAAKTARAHDFIMKLPDGYETVIGRRGQNLSGGERQRIAIARAILHNPRILILDEATASVDTKTEQAIQEAFQHLVKGRTTIAIAHRFSTLRDADRLIVVDKGEIAEIGTHDELIALEGIYYKLWEKQREALAIRGIAVEEGSYA